MHPTQIPRYTDEQIIELCREHSDAEVAEITGYFIGTVQRKRRRGGVVRDPNEGRGLSTEDAAWVSARAAEGWPVSEILAERPDLNYDTLLRHFPLGSNGNAWANVKRWATRYQPELFASIQRMDP